MILEYTIVLNPNPENPNEQPVGNEINDDRLYERTVIIVNTGAQSYNRAFFTKNFNSNKLTIQALSFSVGDIITVKA